MFSPNGTGLKVSVPIHFSGEVGFPGDVARVLAINKKSFDGDIEAYLDISCSVDEGWQPHLNVKPGFDWKNRAEIELVGGVWIHIAEHLNDPLNKALEKAANEMRSRISGVGLKAAVEKVWKAQALSIKQNGATLGYCNVRPTGAFFSGVSAQPEQLVFDVGVSGSAQFSDKPNPSTPEALPLPPLRPEPLPGNQVHLFVPIEASFNAMRLAAIEALKRSEFTSETFLGKATLAVKDVEIYGRKDHIVIGLKFEVRFGKRLFDERGWVYLTTKPILDVGKQELRLEDPKVTRIVNNELWKVLSVPLRRPAQQRPQR